MAVQVAGLQQRYGAEHLADMERVWQAAVKRLEARVQAIEVQGVRSDRRAAELAGLAQALTEEQRALLIRLDRLEEQLRAGCRDQQLPSLGSEDCFRRVHRLEREQRAAAQNMRLIVSVIEEARLGQGGALSYSPVKEAAGGEPRPRSRSGEPLGRTRHSLLEAYSAGAHALQAYLRAHERELGPSGDTQLSAMEQLNARLEAVAHGVGAGADSTTGWSPWGQSTFSTEDLVSNAEVLVRSLGPRTDMLEARVRAVTHAMEELRASFARVESLGSPVLGCTSELEVASYREVTQRMQAHEARISEIVARMDRLATQDELAEAWRQMRSAQSGMNEELRCRLDAIAVQQVETCGSGLRGLGDQAEAIKQLRKRLDSLAASVGPGERRVQSELPELEVPRIEDVANLGRKVQEQGDLLGELRAVVLSRLPENTQDGPLKDQATVAELQARLEGSASKEDLQARVMDLPTKADVAALDRRLRDLPSRDHWHATISDLRARLEEAVTREELQAAIVDLRGRLQMAVSKKDLQDQLQASIAAVQGKLQEQLHALQVRFCDSPSKAAVEDTQASLQEQLKVNMVEVFQDSSFEALEHIRQDILLAGQATEELKHEHEDLRSFCTSLQETVEQRVMVAVWQVEKQLPEALSRLDRLMVEAPERMSKLEEGEVRLNGALTRLSAQEQKVQSCMDRIDRVPSLCQVRSLWREELHRKLEEADLEGLARTTRQHGAALEEQGEVLQQLCDELSFGRGPRPGASGGPGILGQGGGLGPGFPAAATAAAAAACPRPPRHSLPARVEAAAVQARADALWRALS